MSDPSHTTGLGTSVRLPVLFPLLIDSIHYLFVPLYFFNIGTLVNVQSPTSSRMIDRKIFKRVFFLQVRLRVSWIRGFFTRIICFGYLNRMFFPTKGSSTLIVNDRCKPGTGLFRLNEFRRRTGVFLRTWVTDQVVSKFSN